MIPAEARHLTALIFAEARSRGVVLRELTFRIEHEIPVLRFRADGANLRGCRIRVPGGPTSAQKVVTVSGFSDHGSRSWQRRRDDTFDISAIAEFVVALVERERAKPRPPDLDVPTSSPSASGLHVVHLGAVRLGVLPVDSKPVALADGIGPERRRKRLAGRMLSGGLSEADLRVLADVAKLDLWRPNKLDFDPFEPFAANVLPIVLIGKSQAAGIERRYALVLEYEEAEVLLADPAGDGLVTVAQADFLVPWKLGSRSGLPWVGLLGPMPKADHAPLT